MPQDYSFTFQNLNTAPSGWTGNSLASALQSAPYLTPFDPLEASQTVQDTTTDVAASGSSNTPLSRAQDQLARNSALLRNLKSQSGDIADLASLTRLNQQIATTERQQEMLQATVTRLTSSPGGAGVIRSSTDVAAQDLLTTKIAKQNSQLDKQKNILSAHTQSIDALKSAINGTTDPKVIEQLKKQLEKEQGAYSKEQANIQSNTAHVTGLQSRLTALVAPPAPAPVVASPGAGAAPVNAGATPATRLNYWNELVDKTLGSRTGVSGWHSAGAAVPALATAIPPVSATPAAPAVPAVAATPRELTPRELQWRSNFDPRGWINSQGILTPTPISTNLAPVAAAPAISRVVPKQWQQKGRLNSTTNNAHSLAYLTTNPQTGWA